MSVLFCDLVGFTAASESADPEEVRARIRRCHARLRERIEATGERSRSSSETPSWPFSAPRLSRRRRRAGRARRTSILEAIEELNDQDPALWLSVRVGINTGEAVVALGAAPSKARASSPATSSIPRRDPVRRPRQRDREREGAPTGRPNACSSGPRSNQSREGEVRARRPFSPARAVARFGSDVIRSLATPLVGRSPRRRFEQHVRPTARDNVLQLVTIVGEPGVGKSRLGAELFAYLDERPELIRWRQGRCLPYGDGSPSGRSGRS